MTLNQRSSYGFIHVFIPVASARVLPGIKIGLIRQHQHKQQAQAENEFE